MIEVSINTEFIKLDQFLKWAGVSMSGAEAKQIILEGRVKINGEVVLQRGKKVYKRDIIKVEGVNEFIVL